MPGEKPGVRASTSAIPGAEACRPEVYKAGVCRAGILRPKKI